MIRLLINIYILILIIDAILSYIPNMRHQPGVRHIRQLANYTLNPIRKLLPPDLPLDPSPIIAILILNLIMALW